MLRAINGSLNWFAWQTRPDLAAQSSFCQQSFLGPTVHDLCEANHAVWRAKQFAGMPIQPQPIEPSALRLSCHLTRPLQMLLCTHKPATS